MDNFFLSLFLVHHTVSALPSQEVSSYLYLCAPFVFGLFLPASLLLFSPSAALYILLFTVRTCNFREERRAIALFPCQSHEPSHIWILSSSPFTASKWDSGNPFITLCLPDLEDMQTYLRALWQSLASFSTFSTSMNGQLLLETFSASQA